MNIWQSILLAFVGMYSLAAFIKGYRQTKVKNNPYGLSKWFFPISAYVWADAVIFGAFFFCVALLCFILNDFILFLLVFSVFWSVRSMGESVYWFLEQFASSHRNPEHTLMISKWFPRNSSWIAHQTINQCIMVVGIIASVFLFNSWLAQ